MQEVIVNYWAVLAAAITAFIIGGLWYSPLMFAKEWMRLVGKTEEEIKKSSPAKAMAGSFVLSLVIAYVFAHVIEFSEAATWAEGLQGGFWMWLGFVGAIGFNQVLFEGRSKKLFLIDTAYWLAVLLAMGAILAGWR